MNTYYLKKRYSIGFALLFVLAFILGVYFIFYKNDFWEGIYPIIISPILLYLDFKIATEVVIITTAESIKKKTVKKEEVCNWEWIRAIKTKEYYYPSYICYISIYWSKVNEQQQKYQLIDGNKNNDQKGVLIITSFFSNYKQIVTYVVSKTKDIEIDETTRKIIEKVKLNK